MLSRDLASAATVETLRRQRARAMAVSKGQLADAVRTFERTGVQAGG